MPFPHAVIGKPKTPHSLSLFWAHLLLLTRRMLIRIRIYQEMWSLHVLLVFSEPNDWMGGRINNILNSPHTYFGGVALLVG